MRIILGALVSLVVSASAGASPLNCLADNIYREARGESTAGKLMVAHVVLNRANRNPRRICREVARPGQFSWVQHRQTGKFESEALRESRRVARMALASRRRDPTGGATHYHNTSVRPRWAASRQMRRLGRIGHHIVYQELAQAR